MRFKLAALAGVGLLCMGCAGFISGSGGPGGILVFDNSLGASTNHMYRVSDSGGSLHAVQGTSDAFEGSMQQNGAVVTTLDATGFVYRIVKGVATPLNGTTGSFRPCVTPDGSRIVFASTRDGNEEIYAMNGNGSGETNLTNDPSADYYPAISQDGAKIAFQSDRDGNGEIYVMNFNGTGLTRLTNDAGDDTTPAFTPDGMHVIFCSNRSGTYQIYRVDLNGANLVQVTASAGDKFYGSYNLSGSTIFFYETVSGIRNIFRCSANGANESQLTHSVTDVDKTATWVY